MLLNDDLTPPPGGDALVPPLARRLRPLSSESIALLARWRRSSIECRRATAALRTAIADSTAVKNRLLQSQREWVAYQLERAGLRVRTRPSPVDEWAAVMARVVPPHSANGADQLPNADAHGADGGSVG